MAVCTHSNQLLPPALCFRSADIAQTAALQGDALPAACALSQLSRLPSPTLTWFPHLLLALLCSRPYFLTQCEFATLSLCLILFVLADGAYTQRTAILKNSFVVICVPRWRSLSLFVSANFSIPPLVHCSVRESLCVRVCECAWVSVCVCLLCWLFVFCIPLFSLTIFCVNCNKAIWQPTFSHTHIHIFMCAWPKFFACLCQCLCLLPCESCYQSLFALDCIAPKRLKRWSLSNDLTNSSWT